MYLGLQQGCTALSRLAFELVAHLHPTHSLSSFVAVTPWKDLLERVPGGMNEWYVSTTMHMPILSSRQGAATSIPEKSESFGGRKRRQTQHMRRLAASGELHATSSW